MVAPKRTGNLVLWASLAASVAIVALTLVALRLAPPPPLPPHAVGPMLPRIRGPAAGLGPGDVLRALGVGSLTWYVSILAAPLFVWLSRRLPLDRRRWPVSLLAFALTIAVLVTGTALAQYRLSYGSSPAAPALTLYLRAALLTGILPFLVVAALAQALDARARAHEREIEAAQARTLLTEARLEALTARLQPHFLFNTLQGISTLIRGDPEGADHMLARLSDLLREVLGLGDRREVPLAEELRVLDAYLDIARTRFGTRLSVAVEAGEEERRASVPFFLLQPLVENALRHGVESRAGPGSVRIAAARRGDELVLVVEDDGVGADDPSGRPGGRSARNGIGLDNTRARLAALYRVGWSLEHGAREEGGFEVRVTIPFRA